MIEATRIPNKMLIGSKFYDVVSQEEYTNNKNLYSGGSTAIHIDDTVYPIRNRYEEGIVGAYDRGAVIKYVPPTTEEEQSIYDSSKVIDFNNVSDIKEIIERQNEMSSQERMILTSPDNISCYPILETDSPSLQLLKKAINAKNIDLDKYEQRFGVNYTNDKRILQRNTITLPKLTSIANKLDMEVELVIRDSSKDVPNPMGIELKTILTQVDEGGAGEDDSK